MNVISRDQHCVSRRDISDAALKVMARLRGHDYQAYLVGGAVRDLLLGGHPKDFDVATDATPEQVHALFRNSRIIGRRFRIVHVRFGREIIEVTTFRGHHDSEGAEDGATGRDHRGRAQRSDRGLLLRDNVYGTLEEDAVRRDLTINALYYHSGDFCVYDHVGAVDDLAARRIRIIGDPWARYREDPVRMLRVVRFAAKLDFDIEQDTAAAIPDCAPLLADIPPARLFDELLKLFLAGRALATLRLLRRHGLFTYLFDEADYLMDESPVALALVEGAMSSTDQRVAEEKPVTPAFLLAALLWPETQRLASELEKRGEAPMLAMNSAAQQVIARTCQQVAIPRRFSQPMREIWEFQLRLEKRSGKKAAELVEQRRFRAAYDLLLLRERAGEVTGDLGQFWTELQTAPLDDRVAQLEQRGPRRDRPRRRRGSAGR